MFKPESLRFGAMHNRVRNILLFFLFLATTLVLYRKTVDSRFVFDFLDWFFTYQQQGWAGVLHSFDDPSLHHMYHFLFFSAYKLFGLHALPWYILFCAVHALNALLVFITANKLFSYSKSGLHWLAALSAAFLFLISPYQTEVIVWGATIHYLFVTAFALIIIYLFLLYAETGKPVLVYGMHALFFTGLFTHEIIVTVPFIITVLLFVFPERTTTGASKVQVWFKTALPQIALIALYLVMNRIFLGKWVGHYGAETHLKFDPLQLLSAVMKYFAKYVLMAQFLPEKGKGFIYSFTDNKNVILLFLGVVSAIFLFGLVRFNKLAVSTKITLALIAIIFLALFPILNLYFPYYVNIQADRLGYFASIFFYMLIAVFLFSLLRTYAAIPLLFFAAVSVYTLHVNTTYWNDAGSLVADLENSFPKDSSKHYYILNLPDNFNGAYIFRCRGESKIAQRIKMNGGADLNKSITEVLAYNLLTTSDSVIVKPDGPDKLRVELSHWGNWYWRNFEGANSYEDSLVKVNIDEWSHTYTVLFKKKQANDVILYQAGNRWVTVNGFN